MHMHTVIRSRGAIALGGIFSLGTAYVLFEDVIRGGPLTSDHVMTALVLVGTIAAGHFFWPALRCGKLLPAIGLAVLFATGTFICVTGSASRGAEHSANRVQEAAKINEARETVKDDIKRAKADRDRLTSDQVKECASGRGKKCDGASASVEYADSHIAILEARLDRMKAEQDPEAGLKHAALVFSVLSGVSSAAIEGNLILLWPFAKAIMLEIATIVFLGLGLAHGKPPENVGNPHETGAENVEIMKLLRKLKRPVTNDELAAILGVSKGHASKMVSKTKGIARVRQGRHVAITALH